MANTTNNKKLSNLEKANTIAVANFKKEQLKGYNVTAQKQLTAEQKAEFDKKVETFKQSLTATSDSKPAEQKDSKQKDSKTKQNKADSKQKDSKKDSNKPEVIKLAEELKLEVRESTADEKKSRVFLVEKHAIAQVVYSKRGKGFQVKSSTNFEGAEYHVGWANKYAKRVDTIAEVKDIIINIQSIKKGDKKDDK